MSGYRITLFTPEKATPAFQAALETVSQAQAAFEMSPGVWRIDAYADQPIDRAALTSALAVAGAASGVAPPQPWIAPVADVDWVDATAASFPAIPIGRFVIHGGHLRQPPRWAGIPLRIDAGVAFGTGEHATTQLCLEAIERRAKRGALGRVLDMGAGTGVLAFGALRLGAVSALGVDLDARAAATAREAARINGLAGRARFIEADGFANRPVRAGGPYDLLLANILSRPLRAMATPAAAALRGGGVAILSGLLESQERIVANRWRAAGFRLVERATRSGWLALTLQR
ncbi:MAG: 50S ribosomal protein L11 methyltransferase [Pseudomonadota bacterium]